MLRLKTAALLFSSLFSPAALAMEEPELLIGQQEPVLQAPPVIFGLKTLLISPPLQTTEFITLSNRTTQSRYCRIPRKKA